MGSGEKKAKKEDYFSFQVDLKGIIRLLSENLYSSGDVFLRELLQNAVDAIAARREQETDFKDGKIKITYHSDTDDSYISLGYWAVVKAGEDGTYKFYRTVRHWAAVLFSGDR